MRDQALNHHHWFVIQGPPNENPPQASPSLPFSDSFWVQTAIPGRKQTHKQYHEISKNCLRAHKTYNVTKIGQNPFPCPLSAVFLATCSHLHVS